MPRPVSWCCEICGETFAAYEEAVACERTPPPPDWPEGTLLRAGDARLWRVVRRPETWRHASVSGHHREYAIQPVTAEGVPESFTGCLPWLWVSAADMLMEVVVEPSCPT